MTATSAQDREEWLAALHRQHADAVYRYARRRLESEEDAEDVVVEVFATAWRRREDVPEQALPWLYATAAHAVAHVIRGAARRNRLGARLAVVRPLHPATVDPAEQVVAAVEAGAAVRAALAQLPPADAEVLRLWAWEQLEPAQLGEVLGCTSGAARTRLHRARSRLRDALAPRDGAAAAASGSED